MSCSAFRRPSLHDDYHAGVVAAALFGEGMSSPLMDAIRERRALVYYAACSADVMELCGQFVIEASTAPEHLDELFGEVVAAAARACAADRCRGPAAGTQPDRRAQSARAASGRASGWRTRRKTSSCIGRIRSRAELAARDRCGDGRAGARRLRADARARPLRSRSRARWAGTRSIARSNSSRPRAGERDAGGDLIGRCRLASSARAVPIESCALCCPPHGRRFP